MKVNRNLRNILAGFLVFFAGLIVIDAIFASRVLKYIIEHDWQRSILAITISGLLILIIYVLSSIETLIGEKESVEKKVIEERDTARRYFEIAGTILIVINKNNIVELINKKGCDVLGYDKSELIGSVWYKFCPPQKNFQKTRDAFIALMKGQLKETRYFENIVLTKNGEKRLVGWNSTLIKGPNGDIRGTLSSGEDITMRRKNSRELEKAKANAEAANLTMQKILEIIKENEAKLRIITSTANDAIIMMNNQGMISFFNQAATRLFGYSSREAMEKTIFHLLDAKKICSDFQRHFNQALSENSMSRVQHAMEMEGRKKDGSSFPLEMSLASVCVNDHIYAVGILRDIGKRKKDEESLRLAKRAAEKANKAKSEFIANMSHEIRTPMNAILGFSELLAESVRGSVNLEYVSAIHYSGKMLLSLINSVLDLSKIEAGKMDADYSLSNFKLLIDETVAIFGREIRGKKLALIVEINENFPGYLMIDPNRWRQILINLIANAVKYTHKGYVRVSADFQKKTENTGDITVTVEDSGIGIPEDQCEKIFGAFEQVHGQNHAVYGGTGLGLAIIKQLVEMMEGNVSVESELGVKSAFHIKLNDVTFADDVEKVDCIEPFDLNGISFEKSKILIADDLKINRDLIIKYLEHYDFDFIEAETGSQVLERLKSDKPDLILMDVKMPELDGDSTTTVIRKNPQWNNTAVIAVTATAMKGMGLDYKGIFDGVLQKPVSRKALIMELMNFIKHSNTMTKTLIPEAEKNVRDVKDDDGKDYGALLKALEGDVKKQWAQIRETLTVNEIEDFAEHIITLGKVHGAKDLSEWGQKIASQIAFFDIEAVENSLIEYGHFIETFRRGSDSGS